MRFLTISFFLLPCLTSFAQESKTELPWKAFGKVADSEGRPMAGVEIWASTGRGTLRRAGIATSDENGRYELRFGPGVFFLKKEASGLQAAIIGAHKPGFFEENLNRQGRCTGANGEPTDEQIKSWSGSRDRVFVPGKPMELNFVMRPAARVSGKLVDEQGKPLAGYSVALTGSDLSPASSVWASATADEQGRFSLEDIPTTYRFQFAVRKSDPKPPWDDSWASAALRFEKPEGDLHAWFGERQIRLQEFILRVTGSGMHERNAIPIAGNKGLLDLMGDVTERTGLSLSARSATLTLTNTTRQDVSHSLVKDFVPTAPIKPSKTRLTRSRPNPDGEFTVGFMNPEGFNLKPGMHQVIFEVDPGKPNREKIFRQIDVKDGRYEERVKVNPEWLDDTILTITFVTIQPDHNAWVRAFFLDGKGTNYSGIWTSDGGMLPAIAIAIAIAIASGK